MLVLFIVLGIVLVFNLLFVFCCIKISSLDGLKEIEKNFAENDKSVKDDENE